MGQAAGRRGRGILGASSIDQWVEEDDEMSPVDAPGLGALARESGKSHVLRLEPEDLVALTIEAAAMARVPLAGTEWVPGVGAV